MFYSFLKKIIILLLTLLFVSVGCAKDHHLAPGSSEQPGIGNRLLIGNMPNICSTLDFEEVRWPEDFHEPDQMAFALGMNITGSFEGHAGWTNLSNNFDGQGVSMGILNQNLGQGTLQPLFIEMRDSHSAVLKKHLRESMYNSLVGMLSEWERSQASLNQSSLLLQNSVNALSDRRLIDPQDIEGDVDKFYAVNEALVRNNSKSVAWAKKTLYTDSKGRNFKSVWKKALKAIAGEPTYVSLQIAKARYLHDQTHIYRERFGWKQLRSYLYLFDIVVQNGGFKSEHLDEYDTWFANQTRATEEEQMLKMLSIRIKSVINKWKKDVLSRKNTIISGTGFVHGEDRNLPVEYCYDPSITYLLVKQTSRPN